MDCWNGRSILRAPCLSLFFHGVPALSGNPHSKMLSDMITVNLFSSGPGDVRCGTRLYLDPVNELLHLFPAIPGDEMNQLTTPVAFIVFNRPEATRRVFSAIAAARPSQLMLIADGPRANRNGEAERCHQVRQIISEIDWPCEVETNFSNENLGCRRRMISGLNWVFSLVEEAIILEDDCLPDASFFPYCSELLERYRDAGQIGMISGFNHVPDIFPFPYSYYFSRMVSIWGWASWRRCWRHYDEHLVNWPEIKKARLLDNLFPEKRTVDYWARTFDAMHDGTGPNAWGYQMVYSCWIQNWLTIVPGRNLIQNIGFGADATHTAKVDPELPDSTSALDFPLVHPPAITDWPERSRIMQSRFYSPGIMKRVGRKIQTKLRSDAVAAAAQVPEHG
jgi:hypothetical protein